MSFLASTSLRASLRASTSRSTLPLANSAAVATVGTQLRGLATPAEVQAGSAPQKPTNFKEFKIYRWVRIGVGSLPLHTK